MSHVSLWWVHKSSWRVELSQDLFSAITLTPMTKVPLQIWSWAIVYNQALTFIPGTWINLKWVPHCFSLFTTSSAVNWYLEHTHTPLYWLSACMVWKQHTQIFTIGCYPCNQVTSANLTLIQTSSRQFSVTSSRCHHNHDQGCSVDGSNFRITAHPKSEAFSHLVCGIKHNLGLELRILDDYFLSLFGFASRKCSINMSNNQTRKSKFYIWHEFSDTANLTDNSAFFRLHSIWLCLAGVVICIAYLDM